MPKEAAGSAVLLPVKGSISEEASVCSTADSMGGEKAGEKAEPSTFSPTLSALQSPADEDSGAIYNLGQMYAKGIVVEQDKAKALELFETASAAGHAKAAYSLGLMYQRGDSVEQDSAKAAELYEQAHVKGYPKATYNLAVMYERGVGVKQDSEKANELFQLAGKTESRPRSTRPKNGPKEI